jgi:hypothetical protein
MGSLFIFIIL